MHLTREQVERVRIVNDAIRAGRYRLESGPCCCGAEGAETIAAVDRYGLALETVLCTHCATLRFDPYLSAESLGDFYRKHYQLMYARVPDPEGYFARQQHYGARIAKAMGQHLSPGGVVVEVGCGAGGALSVFAKAGFEVYGCDHAEPLVGFGRSKGLSNLHAGDLGTLGPALDQAGKRADLIYLHHVFEHLADPFAWLLQAAALLSDEGIILVAVPDITRSDRFPSPGGDLRLAFHVAHKFNFTIQGLEDLAKRAGLFASPATVECATSAPEVWVMFTRHSHKSNGADAGWRDNSSAMWHVLRRIESGYLRAAVRRRLAKLLAPTRSKK